MKEYVIVGAGITGAVIGRHLAEKGHHVTIVDRRSHIAGNIYDCKDENGLLIQKYGPHIFHTNSERVYSYITKYSEWDDFFLECMVYMNGKYTPSPFNFKTIDDYYPEEKARELKAHIKKKYGDSEKTTIVEMLNSDDPLIKEYADFLFENDYSLYTAKQWGISPKEIDVSVLKRVPVLFSYKTGYFDDVHQCMPKKGFSSFVSNLLEHKNITVKLNTEALDFLSIQDNKLLIDGKETDKTVIYTGAADELLKCKYGVLPYRSLRFEYRTESTDSYQDAPVVAYPQEKGYTRITEYSKLPPQKTNGKTVIALEYPQAYDSKQTEPYYPIPTEQSKLLYEKYRTELDAIPNLILCGRLGDFKYYNMDQAIKRALEICDTLL